GLDQDFPVRGKVEAAAPVEMHVADPERVEISCNLAFGIGEIGLKFRIEPDPEDAASLAERQPAKAIFLLVEGRKHLLAREGHQCAIETEGPGVEGAGHARAAVRLVRLDDAGTPMGAGIEEGVSLALSVSGEKDRNAEVVMGIGHLRLG